MSKYRRRRQKLASHTAGDDRHHKLAAHLQKQQRLNEQKKAAVGEGRKRARDRRRAEGSDEADEPGRLIAA